MMNFRSAAGGSGGGPVLKWSGGSSSSNSNNPCLEQHSINIAATTTTTPTTITTTTAQGFMQITNNMYEGLIDQDSFISSPSLASTAAACINSGYCNTRASTGSDILYYLSVLKEKVQQLQALVATAISNHTYHNHQNNQNHEKEHPTAAATSAASLIHEIIFAASSMAYAFQQLSPVSPPGHLQCKSSEIDHHQQNHYKKQAAPSYAINHDHHDTSQLATTDDNTWIHQHQLSTFGRNSSEAAAAAAGGGQYYNIFAAAAGSSVNETQCQYNTINTTDVEIAKKISDATRTSSGAMAAMELVGNINDTDHKEADDHAIIELEAADLLAKYTHFCQVCGKGFRRDANLRMHMRAHGDEYKTNEALTNPMKRQMLMKNNKSSTSTSTNDELMLEEDPREEEFAAASTAAGLVVSPQNRNQKYSCPHEGCRWNKKHAKFQPLKSMVCVKNHYKRSHCPKMYVCNRCNRKQFSVLSDLRTHEKHCGDNLRWRCSCGTTFSRKDKLMGHVALFVGHAPAIAPHHNNARSISAPLPTD